MHNILKVQYAVLVGYLPTLVHVVSGNNHIQYDVVLSNGHVVLENGLVCRFGTIDKFCHLDMRMC